METYMQTSRRAFFAALAGLTAVDPDRLVWTPNRKLISLPTYPGEIMQLAGQRFYMTTELENELRRAGHLDMNYVAGQQWVLR